MPRPGATPLTIYKSSKAIVVGINRYTQAGWPPLRNAVADANEVAAALRRHGFDVTLKTDLTSREFEPLVRDFFIREGSDPDTRLLFWFAGHGHTLMQPVEEGYLVPADAPAAEEDIGFRSKALAMSQFSYFLTQARAKHVLAVFDCCFSGTALDISRSSELIAPPDVAQVAGGITRLLISSGDRAQKVSDDGTFRRLFIDAISGAVPQLGRNGWVTGQEIGIYLRREMSELTARKATPQTLNVGFLNRAGFNRGDVVFATPGLVQTSLATLEPDALKRSGNKAAPPAATIALPAPVRAPETPKPAAPVVAPKPAATPPTVAPTISPSAIPPPAFTLPPMPAIPTDPGPSKQTAATSTTPPVANSPQTAQPGRPPSGTNTNDPNFDWADWLWNKSNDYGATKPGTAERAISRWDSIGQLRIGAGEGTQLREIKVSQDAEFKGGASHRHWASVDRATSDSLCRWHDTY